MPRGSVKHRQPERHPLKVFEVHLAKLLVSDLSLNNRLRYSYSRVMGTDLRYLDTYALPAKVGRLREFEIRQGFILEREVVGRLLMHRNRVLIGVDGPHVSCDLGPTTWNLNFNCPGG